MRARVLLLFAASAILSAQDRWIPTWTTAQLLARTPPPPTTNATALHTTYIAKEGDATAQESIADATTTQSYYWLYAVEVMAPPKTGLIVAYGDSITDGARSSSESNHSWPALLAARLAA